MDEFEPAGPVCGAPHPSETDVECTAAPGPNGTTDDGTPVHVHSGRGASGVHRWED